MTMSTVGSRYVYPYASSKHAGHRGAVVRRVNNNQSNVDETEVQTEHETDEEGEVLQPLSTEKKNDSNVKESKASANVSASSARMSSILNLTESENVIGFDDDDEHAFAADLCTCT